MGVGVYRLALLVMGIILFLQPPAPNWNSFFLSRRSRGAFNGSKIHVYCDLGVTAFWNVLVTVDMEFAVVLPLPVWKKGFRFGASPQLIKPKQNQKTTPNPIDKTQNSN